jgi:hypothetical protein
MTISDRVILIRPSQLYRADMSADELYEATRGVWRVDPDRAEQAQFVLAVVKGEVIEAYEIDCWQPAGTAEYRFRPRHEVARPGRYEFVGHRADATGQRYVGESVDEYLPKGTQNPVRYVNC